MNDRHAHLPRVELSLTVLAKSEGGRNAPIIDQEQYMPHIVIGDPNQRRATVDDDGCCNEDYLGVRLLGNGEVLMPGAEWRICVALMYYPDVDYSAVTKGARFTMREGGRVVAFGEVVGDIQFENG